MSARVYRVEALVLKRQRLGEADLIVRLFCRERGKISAVAKGARRPKSKLGGATEPGIRLTAQLARGRSLEVLAQAQTVASRLGLRADLRRAAAAAYLLELTEAALEERQPATELYDLLDTALDELCACAEPVTLTHAFELQALGCLGFEPALYECVVDGVELPDGGPRFDPARGGLICPGCELSGAGGMAVSPATVRALRGLSRLPLTEAGRTRLLPATVPELARLLPAFVRHSLEAPLRSLGFWNEVAGGPDEE